MNYVIVDGKIVNKDTGEIINTKPKFKTWTKDDYKAEFDLNKEIRFLEPMTCKECPKTYPTDGWIAQEKLDGHRALMFLTGRGNRFFSRRISKKTGWYAENTDCVPHLRELEVDKSFYGTVLDGEITSPTGEFSDIQGVTGALPETAIANQIEKGLVIFNAFDILYYKGMNIQNFEWERRQFYLAKAIAELNCDNVKMVPSFPCKNVKEVLKSFWEQGKEGLVLKNVHSRYEQKRSKNWLKCKDAIYKDVVIMGYQEPTRDYDGKTLEDKGYWDYWYDAGDDSSTVCQRMSLDDADSAGWFPATKPYAMGWIGAIECGVYKDGKLVKVAEVKGISDADQIKIAKDREALIGVVIEIKAQEVIDLETGSLRHPRFSRWREDKSGDMCTWEAYIDSGEEE